MLFIQQIPKEMTQQILASYQRKLGFNYRIDINNIYELVFNQFIAKSAVHPNRSFRADDLLLSEQELAFLYSLQQDIPIDEAVNKLLRLDEYYQKTFEKFVVSLKQLEGVNSLKNWILWKDVDDRSQKLFLHLPMPEGDYAKLVQRIVNDDITMTQLASELLSPYDILNLIHDKLLSEGQESSLIQSVDLNLVIGLIFWLKQERYEDIAHLDDLLSSTSENQLILEIKHRLLTLDKAAQKEIDELIEGHELEQIDFS